MAEPQADIEWGPTTDPNIAPTTSSSTPHRQSSSVDIHHQPWKHVGYRGYSQFISSRDDLFILRRFSALSVRVALSLQHELVVLERELEDLDDGYAAQEEPPVSNGCFEDDQEDREMLLRIIGEKLRRYCKWARVRPRLLRREK